MTTSRVLLLGLVALALAQLRPVFASPANPGFAILVVDQDTGRGVPLVELRTVNQATWWTDSAGLVAFDEPGLFGQDVYFHVSSPGYVFPADGFGNRGVTLRPAPGGTATIKLRRLNIAERLYRETGEGIYRDSVRLGRPAPLQRPLLNAQVVGQDTVIVTPYRGKLYWFWGDTDRVSYPLGNFAASGATSEWPGRGGLDPGTGVDLSYFVDAAGFSKPMCPDFGPGLHWIESVMTVPDETGVERLVARVASQKGLVPAYAWHLAVFNDDRAIFESKVRWDWTETHDSSHPFRATVRGVDYLYLYPNLRVPRRLDAVGDLTRYEALTCVAGDGKFRGETAEVERDSAGQPRYTWKPGADRLHRGRLEQLVAAGKLKSGEGGVFVHDIETGAPVSAGRGSVAWNEYRRRWVMLFSAQAGEIWFAEADTPSGPWVYARRVVTHGDYNFYNPTQHAFFDQAGGRVIYFEGTYTAAFSSAKAKTPRYDYNQMMYRLTLDDARLALPAPVYLVRAADGIARYALRERVDEAGDWARITAAPFFAVPPAQTRAGLIPVYAGMSDGQPVLEVGPAPESRVDRKPLFLALPVRPNSADEPLDGLWRFTARTSDDSELSFEAQLAQRGTGVEIVDPASGKVGSGELNNGRLKLNLTSGTHRYELTGERRERALAGEWKQLDGADRGTWSAARLDPNAAEDGSPAVVPLFEVTFSDGRRMYTTESAKPESGGVRSAEPICRVWKNPLTVLVLDPEAKPVLPVGP